MNELVLTEAQTSALGYAWRAAVPTRRSRVRQIARGGAHGSLSVVVHERRRALGVASTGEEFAELLFVNGSPIDAVWARITAAQRADDHDCDCTCAGGPGHLELVDLGEGWVTGAVPAQVLAELRAGGEVRVRLARSAA